MCGRYLIEEEAYSDILEILYRSGTLSPISPGATGNLPGALREALAMTLQSKIDETVPQGINDLFPGASPVVTNGEVFPTNIAPVLVNQDTGIMLIKWGFPHWKDSGVIINARSETALEKKMFRDPLLNRRCVIPSTGFFEWGSGRQDNLQIGMFGSGSHENTDFTRRRRDKKTKYLLRHPDDDKLYMAGFWNTFGDNGDAFVILTTAANDSVSPIHNRMPLILSADEKDDWLTDISFVQYALMRPGPELVPAAA